MGEKKKIGLALGGGGARGFSHIGVIKALQKEGIEPDIITGTSIGSLVGSAYAAGRLDQLEKVSRNISLTDIPKLLSPTVSHRGFFSGTNTIGLIDDVISEDNIEELPKPFAAIAVDLNSYSIQTFREGNLREAIRASISIPVVFTPVESEGQLLVDGGILEPVPVECARTLGADVVIAVDLFGNTEKVSSDKLNHYREYNEKAAVRSTLNYLKSVTEKFGIDTSQSIIDILELTLMTSQKALTKSRLEKHPAEVVISPAVNHVGFLDFHKGEPIIEQGRTVAEGLMTEIQNILEA